MRHDSPYARVRRFCSRRRHTRSARSRSSAVLNSARPSPMTISGSGATTSVHCRNTEQTWSSSTRSRSRAPYRLCRSPTQTNCRPVSGWNGCVTRTRRAPESEKPAVRGELQAPRSRDVRMARGQWRRRACRVPRRAAGTTAARLRCDRTARATVATSSTSTCVKFCAVRGIVCRVTTIELQLAEARAAIADRDAKIDQLARDVAMLQVAIKHLLAQRRGGHRVPAGQGLLFPEAPSVDAPKAEEAETDASDEGG